MEKNAIKQRLARAIAERAITQSIIGSLLRIIGFFLLPFAVMHLADFRQYTSVLIGAGSLQFFDTFRGVAYVMFYFVSISIVPMMLITALLLYLKMLLSVAAQ